MINIIILDGRLTNDAIYKDNGQFGIATFTIAHNELYKNEKQTAFIDCVAFGNQALFLKKNGVKGSKIVVQGKLKQENFTKRDGTKQTKLSIVCNMVDLTTESGSRDTATIGFEPQTQETKLIDDSDDDLPF